MSLWLTFAPNIPGAKNRDRGKLKTNHKSLHESDRLKLSGNVFAITSARVCATGQIYELGSVMMHCHWNQSCSANHCNRLGVSAYVPHANCSAKEKHHAS